MSGFKIVAAASSAFSAVGAAVGFGVAGPVGATEGAKVGLALGAQVGMLAKGEEAADAVGAKLASGIDAAGEKLGIAADKTGEAIQKLCEVSGKCIVQIADVWSKLALCGYTINMAMGSSHVNVDKYNLVCKTAYESLNCATMSVTTLSLNMLIVSSTLAAGITIYHLVRK
jgi:hypothetical protein